MSNERWQQLERIFAEARELPVEARTGFLRDVCGADDGLRNEAQRLLAADDASGDFMASPAFDRLAQSVATEGWTLQPGERIGAYTVVRRLGVGGAGEVWRARDERLGRDVAIKVLLPHFSSDAERLRRFADEARAAGALNHPNILTVYDVGEHRGMPFLVSECLEGWSLRQRMDAGPVPLEEALSVTLEIARGLATAHARGIVHRDLKPENTFIRSDGGVKILDFGLAKLQSGLEGPWSDASHALSGVIAGTPGYMAPEQLSGERADARVDLFALGVMSYEMLGGQHPFRRASTFETLHAVLTIDPPDLSTINERVPPPLARIAMRLLKKVPDARFQSALDLGWALEQVAGASAAPAPGLKDQEHPPVWWRSGWAAWVGASAVTVGVLLGGAWLFRDAPRQRGVPPLTQFTWTLPAGLFLGSAPVVSPDSQHIAFVGKDASSSRLFVRALGAREPAAIPGTEGAAQPFWAPDSRSLGFFARGRLMKVAWPSGAPVAIASAPQPRGGTWSPSGDILFAPDVILAGISRVPAAGGSVAPATLFDVSKGDTSHWWPFFLPDGLHFLYFVRSTDDERLGVYLGRGDRPASHPDSPLFRSSSDVVFAPLAGTRDGALFSVVDGRIEVRRFDVTRRTVAADARTIGLSAGGSTLHHPVMLSASNDVLVFSESGLPSGHRLEAVRRNGERLRLWDEAEAQNWPRVSPDGRRLARQRVHGLSNNPDIWVEDLERGTRVRVTTAVEPDLQPVWSPDGRHLAYVSGNLPGRAGQRILSIAGADGTGVIRTLPCPAAYCEPADWGRDAGVLLVNARDARGWDVWTVSTEEGGGARPLLAEDFDEHDARFSPDGRYIAYVSEESGRSEVSVQAFSGPRRRFAVSADGGAQPVWRRDGTELFFVDPKGHLRSVSVQWTGDGTPKFGLPTRLDVPPVGFGHWGTQYDVSPDGSRIYFLRANEDQPPREIHVVIGWRELLD
jgi:eukaryotic-like serine/threonine-protein kinase